MFTIIDSLPMAGLCSLSLSISPPLAPSLSLSLSLTLSPSLPLPLSIPCFTLIRSVLLLITQEACSGLVWDRGRKSLTLAMNYKKR